MSEWKPIETAPKDGTDILIAQAGCERVYKGGWATQAETGHGAWRVSDNFWSEAEGAFLSIKLTDDFATHWMPIPAPPATVSPEAGDE